VAVAVAAAAAAVAAARSGSGQQIRFRQHVEEHQWQNHYHDDGYNVHHDRNQERHETLSCIRATRLFYSFKHFSPSWTGPLVLRNGVFATPKTEDAILISPCKTCQGVFTPHIPMDSTPSGLSK
jgi:hypothetical protein